MQRFHFHENVFLALTANLLIRIQDTHMEPVSKEELNRLLEDYTCFRNYLEMGSGMTEDEKKIMDLIRRLIIDRNAEVQS